MAANPEVGGSNLTAGGRNCFGEQLKYGSHVVNWTHVKKNTFSIKTDLVGGWGQDPKLWTSKKHCDITV